MQSPLLEIQQLNISLKAQPKNSLVQELSFSIQPGEILGVVGESGSGKSLTALSIIGLLNPRIFSTTADKWQFEGLDLNQLSEKELQKLRGRAISMIFQEPMSSLNPSQKCGHQVAEVLTQHTDLSKKVIKKQVLESFKKVKLPDVERIYDSYPHQLSGGQKQRIMIAMAIACKPKLLIADEPTTALDVTVQKEIIELLYEIQANNKMSILFITHDLALIKNIAHRILVLYQGKMVELDSAKAIFNRPQQAYTKALIAARPTANERPKRLPVIEQVQSNNYRKILISKEERKLQHEKIYAQAPLLTIQNLGKTYFSKLGFFKHPKAFHALKDINLNIYPGETFGLVGESGCGKSTLGNIILGLSTANHGNVLYRGKAIEQLRKADQKKMHQEIQLIFQDPFASLNPKLAIGKALLEPMQVHHIGTAAHRREKVIDLLQKVGLDETDYDKYPHEFSGGQRQRIGIARALSVQPKLIVCDESVSALDLSVQAQVLNLLNDLKEDFGFTYLFISHDLSIVKYMSDRIAVMENGKIIECKEADMVYQNPEQEYTKKLIAAIPK
ncbi:MAG: ABC transporter ATP-binding protein [Flavobacteriaceae bacterium]|nr:ABC transporter ATP-binding protein [Flavobacteriaceae bacterium]